MTIPKQPVFTRNPHKNIAFCVLRLAPLDRAELPKAPLFCPHRSTYGNRGHHYSSALRIDPKRQSEAAEQFHGDSKNYAAVISQFVGLSRRTADLIRCR